MCGRLPSLVVELNILWNSKSIHLRAEMICGARRDLGTAAQDGMSCICLDSRDLLESCGIRSSNNPESGGYVRGKHGCSCQTCLNHAG